MSRYKVTIEVESASGPQAEVFIKHFLRDATTAKVIKATKICGPKPRRKWFVYINGKLDRNSMFCGGVAKARATKWVKGYKQGYTDLKRTDIPNYLITTVLQK